MSKIVRVRGRVGARLYAQDSVGVGMYAQDSVGARLCMRKIVWAQGCVGARLCGRRCYCDSRSSKANGTKKKQPNQTKPNQNTEHSKYPKRFLFISGIKPRLQPSSSPDMVYFAAASLAIHENSSIQPTTTNAAKNQNATTPQANTTKQRAEKRKKRSRTTKQHRRTKILTRAKRSNQNKNKIKQK